ncbi:hypothetical protein HRbin39_01154 [bacterium HR39]|nr:hypothetical protein HRbin39_01154 [bacterium HR39]
MQPRERELLRRLLRGIPVDSRPFAEVARELGMDEAEVAATIRRWLEEGLLTRFGPMFDIERLGGAVTLCAMAVPQARFEEVAAMVNAHPEVAHNYEREHRFNMWFVIAAESRAEIDRVIAEIERETRLQVVDLPKEREYFLEFIPEVG